MARIPRFQRTFIASTGGVENTSQFTNQALQNAGRVAEDIALDIGRRRQEAAEANWYNENAASFERQMDEAWDEFKTTRSSDPVGAWDEFDQVFKQRRDELAKTAPTDAARQTFVRGSEGYRTVISRRGREWENSTQVENFATSLDNSAQDIYNSAYRNANPAELERYLKQADRMTIAGATFMDPTKLEKMRQTMRSNIANSMASGMIETNPYAAKKALEGGTFDGAMDSADIQKLHKSSIQAVKRVEAENKARQTEAFARATVGLADMIDRMKDGYAIPHDEMEGMESLVMQSGDAKTMRKFQSAKQTSAYAQLYKKQTPIVLQNTVNELRAMANKDGATQEEVLRLGVAEGILKTMNSGLKNDPLSTAAELGFVNVQPIAFEAAAQGDVATLQKSMQERAQVASFVSSHYGVEPKLFTDEEARAMGSQMNSLETADKIRLGTSIKRGFGQFADDALRQIGKEDPVFAHAIGLNDYNPRVAYDVLEGQKVMKGNPAFKPKPTDVDSQFVKTMGTALYNMPEVAGTVRESAMALYAQRMAAKGEDNQVFNAEAFDRAVKDVLGADPADEDTGIVAMGDGWFDGMKENKIILPPGINKNKFELYLKKLDANEADYRAASMGGMRAMDGAGRVQSIDTILKKGTLEQIDPFLYQVRMPNGDLLRGGGKNGQFVLLADPDRINALNNRGEIRATPPSTFDKIGKALGNLD